MGFRRVFKKKGTEVCGSQISDRGLRIPTSRWWGARAEQSNVSGTPLAEEAPDADKRARVGTHRGQSTLSGAEERPAQDSCPPAGAGDWVSRVEQSGVSGPRCPEESPDADKRYVS